MIRKMRSGYRSSGDPTPAEIRRRTEIIRRGWSEAELSRRCGFKPVAWMVPLLSAIDLPDWLFEAEGGA